MFEWLKAIAGDEGRLDPLLDIFHRMLLDGRHMFDLAANALVGGTDPEMIRRDLFKTDIKINKCERKLRRKLIVHASVHGAAEFPTCLVLMSIAKDAERIGDYCKNIYDLSHSMAPGTEIVLTKELRKTKDKIGKLLRQTIEAYQKQDQDLAVKRIKTAEELEDRCDEQIRELITKEVQGEGHVVTALAFRYFKRVASHSRNILSSIVMPLDKLDYAPDEEDQDA